MNWIWNKIIRCYDKLINWSKNLIRLRKKQIEVWWNEPPRWIRAIIFIPRFVSSTVFAAIRKIGQWGVGRLKGRAFWELTILLVLAVSSFVLLFWEFKEQETVRNLILLIAGIVGWYFLARRTKAAEQEAKTAEQGLTVTRLTRATEQIANSNPSIRLGGMISFEQIAEAHKEEREQIVQILSARIHELAPQKDEEKTKKRSERLDIEIAVQVLANIAKPLENKKLSLCELFDTNLSRLRFYNMDLSYFDFTGTNFSRTIIGNTSFNGAYLRNTEFSRAYLRNIEFRNAVLHSANLSNAALDDADLSNAKLYNANLSGASLDDVNLSKASLNRANLSNASLDDANLSNTKLYGTNLSGASLDDANLSGASLDDANLSGASLNRANLSNASLDDTDISNVDFKNATGLTQKQINKAFHRKGHPPQNLPDKLKPPKERDYEEKNNNDSSLF